MPKLKENIPIIKGNIPIQEELLNKYSNVEEIFENESINDINVRIDTIKELNNIEINDLKIEELKKLANNIFDIYHSKNVFKNKKNAIIVTNQGINESVQKVYYSKKQKIFLKEHLIIYSILGRIIEEAILINQVPERKNRTYYKCWHYFLDGLVIGKKTFLIEFDVVSLDNGENHYHVQRLKLI